MYNIVSVLYNGNKFTWKKRINNNNILLSQLTTYRIFKSSVHGIGKNNI